jgi:diguanylate cyclase (GGDEF)-like protein
MASMTEKQTIHPTASDPALGNDAVPTSVPQWRVLIADDDAYIRQLLELALSEDGFEVLSAADGYELVQLAQERTPNLILVDLSMPRMDGYEAIRQMRNDTRTAHIPMLILTARSGVKDIVIGFETGADDYIAKPFDINELLARVRSHLRRSAQRPVLNPLTGMPGGVLLSQELRHRLGREQPLALLYADLDNFKAFNDIYGFSRGDQALLFVAGLIQRVMAEHGNSDDFIGHIGGDDFVMLTTPDRIDEICGALIDTFDQEIGQLYNLEDRQRGYISSADRYGILRRFSLMTISIGVVTTERRRYDDEESLTRVAAEMKRYAKEQGGSTYAVDQRNPIGQNGPLRTVAPDRRGQRQRRVLIASDDSSLRVVLRSALRESGYLTYETACAETLRQRIAEERPAVVLADAQLGAPLWDLCAEQASPPSNPAIVVLAYEDDNIKQARAAGANACLRLPLPLADIVACIDRLAGNGALADGIPAK